MPYQSTLQLTGVSPETVDQLLTDPSRARDLIIDSIPELLTHIAGRVASLKTLEGTLLWMMLTRRVANSSGKSGESALLSTPQVAKLSEYPNRGSESRLGSEPCHRSDWATTFDSRHRTSSASSPSAPNKPPESLTALDSPRYSTVGSPAFESDRRYGTVELTSLEPAYSRPSVASVVHAAVGFARSRYQPLRRHTCFRLRSTATAGHQRERRKND